jgi:hypothetical protein
MVTLGLLFAAAFFYTFTLIGSFKIWFVVLRFQKWFGVDVSDFQIELCRKHFGKSLAWQLFGLLFPKIG